MTILQATALNAEIAAMRKSLHVKDAELANAQQDGSSQLQSLEEARQGIAGRLEAAQQEKQVAKPCCTIVA